MTNFSWTCPFCQRPVTVRTETDVSDDDNKLAIENKDGFRIAESRFIVCPNPECKKVSFEVKLYSADRGDWGGVTINALLHEWSLVPESKAMSFPDYIPKETLIKS